MRTRLGRQLRADQRGFTLLELLVVLAILGILLGLTALRITRMVSRASTTADQAELEILQRAMWAHQVVDEVQAVPTALCISDLGACTPALYPRFVRDRTVRPGNAYSWTEEGIVYRCGEETEPTIEGSAAFYANASLSGEPVLMREDTAVSFNWGNGSPDPLVPYDNFSARWHLTQSVPGDGVCRYVVTADDGVRLYVDGECVLDKWFAQPATTYRVYKPLSAGNHSLVLEYFENFWHAEVSLAWNMYTEEDSFQGTYYAGRNLSGEPLLQRADPAIDFDWGTSSPDPAVPDNQFSVRWQGSITLEQSGSYRFTTTSDDGVRLYVDGVLRIDEWRPMAATSHSAEFSLPAGEHSVVMEYFEAYGHAVARMQYQQVF